MTWLFAAALFVSAALSFWAQPLLGRLLLPTFGGVPAVWTACLLFAQSAVLLGYLYAHLLASRLGWPAGAVVHLGVVLAPAAVLPFAVPADPAVDPVADPTLAVLVLLAAAAGPPLVAVSATAPLLQRWFAGAGRADPYPLYAASNLGSLAGLAGYPLLLEPALRLDQQGYWWAAGYGLFVALTAACAVASRPTDKGKAFAGPVDAGPPPTWGEVGGWAVRAAVPASLLAGVTAHLTTEVAPVPLLWVVPLGLYLGTFVAVFGGSLGWLRAAARVVAPGVIAAELFLQWGSGFSVAELRLGGPLAAFAVAALAVHDDLAARRPRPARLTAFYLWVAVGGAAGGAVNAVLAPVAFPTMVEYPLALAVALALTLPRAAGWAGGRWWAGPAAAAGLYGLFLLAVADARSGRGELLGRTRNFFGVTEVYANDGFHELLNGNIAHGFQYRGPDAGREPVPRGYYHPSGPAGDLFAGGLAGRPVGVVGLGVGSLAGYAEPGQEWVFFEINPAVVRAAQNPAWFTHLSACRGEPAVVVGDARLSLAREPDGRFGLLVVDAFSGDAIPVHLLTTEAVGLYRRKLAAGGAVAFHVSNRYLDLVPVLGDVAAAAGLEAAARLDPAADRRERKSASLWVVLFPPGEPPAGVRKRAWQPVPPRPGRAPWADGRADLLAAVRWE